MKIQNYVLFIFKKETTSTKERKKKRQTHIKMRNFIKKKKKHSKYNS